MVIHSCGYSRSTKNCCKLNLQKLLHASYYKALSVCIIVLHSAGTWMVEDVCASLYNALNDPPKNYVFLDISKA